MKYLKWSFGIGLGILFVSCNKTDTTVSPKEQVVETTDASFFKLITSSGYTYYKNDTTPRTSVAESFAHGNKVVIKFNAKAASALGSDGKLPEGATFPDSSLIVKEIIYTGSGPKPYLLAGMWKSKKDKNNANGWVWGEYKLDGAVLATVTLGSGCVPCHSRSGNRDLVRTFGVF